MPFNRFCILVLLSSLTGASSALAADPFAGKTITIYVGSGAGGVYDVFARLVARHIARHIAGEPNVVVSPMPGAGGVTASNYLYNVAAKDGTALAVVSPSLKVMETSPGAKYLAEKFNWIGRIVSTSNVTFTFGPDKVKTVQDAMQRESTIAVTAAGSALSIFTRALNATAGTKFKPIHGYVDAAAGLLAVERGEVDGATFSWNSLKNMRPQWLAQKQANILVQYAPWVHSQLKDVPNAVDLARPGEDREMMKLFMSAADIGLSLKAPPGTPADRVEILRKAFSDVMRDPAFKEDAAKIEPDFDPLPGAELQKIVEASAHATPAMLERVRAIVNGN